MKKGFQWLFKYNSSKQLSTFLSTIVFIVIFTVVSLTTEWRLSLYMLLLVALFFLNRILEDVFRNLLGERNVEVKTQYHALAIFVFGIIIAST